MLEIKFSELKIPVAVLWSLSLKGIMGNCGTSRCGKEIKVLFCTLCKIQLFDIVSFRKR